MSCLDIIIEAMGMKSSLTEEEKAQGRKFLEAEKAKRDLLFAPVKVHNNNCEFVRSKYVLTK